VENFLRLMGLGARVLQLDQQVGFYTDICYSEDHDHAPGYGPWMTESMRGFIREVVAAIKKTDPNAVLAYEFPCEVWIQEAQLVFHRPYMIGTVPLFDYLYHEYALCYGGDVRIGLCHPESALIKHAYCFAFGLQNLVGVGEPEYDFEVNPGYPVLTLLRNICQAQRTFANEYAVFGQMQRPTALEVRKDTIDLYRYPGTVEIPRVVHAVWRSPGGKTGYLLVNWTGAPEDVVLSLRGARGPVRVVTESGSWTAPAAGSEDRTVALTVPARGVLLAEHA
jgi:hypothetical protein